MNLIIPKERYVISYNKDKKGMDIALSAIAEHVCAHFGIETSFAFNTHLTTRQSRFVLSRQIIQWIATKFMSDAYVAQYFNFDCSTIINNRNRIIALMEYEKPLEKIANKLLQELTPIIENKIKKV